MLQVVPFEPGTLRVTCFLTPGNGLSISGETAQNGYDMVPSFLLQRHGEAIASGALARLLMEPGEPYTDPAMASVHAQRFQAEIDENFDTATRGSQARPPVRTRARFM